MGGYKPAGLKLVLITNGSMLQRDNVQQGLRRMAQLDGEVWFKLDRASEAGMLRVNDTKTTLDKVRQNLRHRHRLLPQHLAANLLVRAGWHGTRRAGRRRLCGIRPGDVARRHQTPGRAAVWFGAALLAGGGIALVGLAIGANGKICIPYPVIGPGSESVGLAWRPVRPAI